MSKGKRIKAERLVKPRTVRKKEELASMLRYKQRLRDRIALDFEHANPSTVDEAWRMNTLFDLRDDNLATPLLDGAL